MEQMRPKLHITGATEITAHTHDPNHTPTNTKMEAHRTETEENACGLLSSENNLKISSRNEQNDENENCGIEEEMEDLNLLNPCLVQDHNYVKDNLPRAAILTLTKEYITVVIMRTAYSRLQLRLQYSVNYPNELPIIELTSPSLPPPLLRNKEKETQELAKEHLGNAQFQVIYEFLHEFIHTNLFVSCWKEVKQVMTLCEGKGNLSANEKEGLLKFRLREGNYRQPFNIRIPSLYPEEGVEIEFLPNSNFPVDIQNMYLSQAQELCRRCVAGISPEQFAELGHRERLQAATRTADNSNTPYIPLTSTNLKDIKHDVNVLKQLSDLRTVTQRGDKQITGQDTYSQRIQTAIKKEARKDLRRLAQAESEYDREQLALIKAQEQAEMVQLMKSKISSTSLPSLLHVVRYLVQEYVCKLPNESCQKCEHSVFPVTPESEESSKTSDSIETGTKKKSKKKGMSRAERKPIRSVCGHWFHYKCLDEWLTTPPFLRHCNVCQRRIYHPDWPEDIKAIERTWQAQQAKKREIADVADFLDMGGDFRK